MKIWFINHYAVPPEYYPLARPSQLAKNLMKMGHEVTIIAASTVHNSDKNLIEGSEQVKKEIVDGIPYVYIKCSGYQGNGLKRVINILEFAKKLPNVCASLEQPDAIVSTSFDPLSCYQGIRYAKKHGIKAVAEIADLWPETLVAYGAAKKNNPFVVGLRAVEKRIYVEADAIVFTMEGAYDYIREQGWEKAVPSKKVFYINNGIDLEEFDYNKSRFVINDDDLLRDDIFKVVYTGSINRTNNVGMLIDVASRINNPSIKILVWGGGDELEELKQRAESAQLKNIVFKGKVAKKYIPYIVSHADIAIAYNSSTYMKKYGVSLNKMFDYAAAAKPTLFGLRFGYNPIIRREAGIDVEVSNAVSIAEEIEKMALMPKEEYALYCVNARKVAEEYDFKVLASKMLSIIESIH